MKQCTKCEKVLPEIRFAKKGKYLRSRCRSCTNEDNLERYHNRWETKVAHKRASFKHRLKSYGLTIESYESMLESQGGGCKLCGSNNQLCVDHCHKTGKVRGLLCQPCNVGLGKFNDDVELMLKAVEYLNENASI